MKLAGNIICLAGAVIWAAAYFVGGPEPIYDWPSWAFLPNLTAEIGALVCILGAVLAFLPSPRKT